MATNAENNSEPQRYSESDLKKLKTWSLESRAHQALKDYRVKWEAVRDGPSSTPADVRLACLMLNQPPEAEQRRIEAESRIWAHESELRDLIPELHPGEDGKQMLDRLDAFVKDENTRILVAELAVKHADEHLSAEKSNKAEIAKKIDNEIYAFFPLHTIEGGDGRVKRLQWVAALEPNITTPVPAQTTATPSPVNRKKWTPEKLAELAEYRESHTMPETAAKFRISETRIRQLLPRDKPKANPYAALIHRTK